ncbi:MAG TPA: response regulator [Clostridia bacterium]|nr:response regulator [Clostridia bacterium]
MRIMIVEDEQRARRGLRDMITSISDKYEVVSEALNGNRALELIPTIKPDAVFTDIRMPYMDGISLIKAVNAMNIDTEFVIISAYEQFEVAREAISLNVTEYLVKPLTYGEVKDVLKRLEDKKSISKSKSLIALRKRYPNAHLTIIKALNIIEKCYASKISQEDIAQTLGITPEYLSYLFHKEIGNTFSRFLRDYRIEVAKSLLLNEGVPRRDVPYCVGFSDPKYFNKVFRDTVGQSITEFMKANRLN